MCDSLWHLILLLEEVVTHHVSHAQCNDTHRQQSLWPQGRLTQLPYFFGLRKGVNIQLEQ